MSMTDVPPDEEPEEPENPEQAVEDLGLGIELTGPEREEAERMVARLMDQFGVTDQGEEPEPEPEPEVEPEPEPEPEVEPEHEPEPEPEQPVASEWISIDGRSVPVEEARSMLELRRYLAQNPDAAERVRAAIEEPAKAEAPAPEPPQPPEWLDLEDPSQRFFWEQTQAQSQAIIELQRSQAASLQQQERTRALGDVQTGMETFRRNHPELSEADIDVVRTHAVSLNIIPGLQQGRSGSEAVLKALDLAYADHPTFRARATGEPTPAEKKQAQNKDRKQKLGGLAGSSGSAPRQPEPPQRPSSDGEMRAQAAKWLSEQGIL